MGSIVLVWHPSRRGHGRNWQRLRQMVLSRQPMCACGENTFEHLRPMCQRCHSRKTVAQDGGLGLPRQ